LSVIISTYNAPQWLEKAIWGYAAQSHHDFELLIADDGSAEETAVCIERLQREVDFAIKHIWHEDKGFRKCMILNKAIAAAANEYLVFSDGDCIPRWDFLAAHAALAERGRLLSGGVLRLSMALSERITKQDILTHCVTAPAWLVSNGLGTNNRLRWLTYGPRMASFLDAVTTTKATWNGGNASGWREDLLRVNGYDERLQYGGLDRELGERLTNAGVHGKQIRHRAVAVHLDHARPYMRPQTWRCNEAIRRETRQSGATWTPYGIQPPLHVLASEDSSPTGPELLRLRAAA
jgi:glycosyltransferase involved in cell wall biosynthesis